jgi:hypothetical protein
VITVTGRWGWNLMQRKDLTSMEWEEGWRVEIFEV